MCRESWEAVTRTSFPLAVASGALQCLKYYMMREVEDGAVMPLARIP